MTDSVLLEKLRSLRVAIVTHVYATGPAQELESYLKDKVAALLFIGHPFKFADRTDSFYDLYQEGVIKKKSRARCPVLPDLLTYFKDLIYTFIWIISSRGKFDVYFGVDPLNALAGVFLKKIGKVKKVIFYMIDYAPKRFDNVCLNWIYHKIDGFCVRKSDFVWNLSERMAEERAKKGIVSTGRQIVVPIGVNFDGISRPEDWKSNRKRLVYMGHLRKNQGLELIIDSFREIVKEVPEARLVIIGGGPLEDKLKKSAKAKGLQGLVEFSGYVPDHREVERMLVRCGIGLALYEPDPDSFSWYTDPGKPKQYMACGLPVIITAVPRIHEEVSSRKLGIVVEYSLKSLVDGALRFLRDDRLYLECRNNAIEFSSQLSWDIIFGNALNRCL